MYLAYQGQEKGAIGGWSPCQTEYRGGLAPLKIPPVVFGY